MAGRRILYGLALAGCLIFYGAYREWFAWILLLTVLLFPWLSLVLSLPAMLRTKVELSAGPMIPIGTAATVRLDVHARDPQPPLKTGILVTKPLTGEKWILKPGGGLPADHCGGLTARLIRPRIYDYLGLFAFPVRKTADRKFIVWPEPVRIEIPAGLTGYLARSWRPKPGGGYAENHEIRQYHPGDNLNQIHWKLSAKVGGLMLREPMEPERGLLLLTLDLRGAPEELDRKFGRLLWLGSWLLERSVSFEIRALSGSGIESFQVRDEWSLRKAMESLLCAPGAAEGTIRDKEFSAAWQRHIGGEPDEA